MEQSFDQTANANDVAEYNRRRASRRVMHTDVKEDVRANDRRSQAPGVERLIADMIGLGKARR